jgi:hypothetical protein
MKKLIFAIALVLISLFSFFATPVTSHAEDFTYAYVVETYQDGYWIYTYYNSDGGVIKVVMTDRRY